MNESALLYGLRFVDSFFPAGGYAYSFGLEAAAQEGMIRNGKTLGEYLVHLARFGVGRSDAVAATTAHRGILKKDIEMIRASDRQLEAMKACREMREGSRQMGRQVIRVAFSQFDHPILQEFSRLTQCDETPCHHAVALGAVLAVCGWSEGETVLAYLYQTVVGWVSAGLRLLPMGQQEGQNLIHDLLPCLIQVGREAEDLSLGEMVSWTPLHEIRAMQHAQLEVRLFRS